MRLLARLVCACAALTILACGGDGIEPGGSTGTVAGIIRDGASAQPLDGSSIVVAGLEAHSGGDGSFRVEQVPVGRQPLSVAHDGYLTLADSVSVEGGSTTQVTLALTQGAAPPPPPSGVSASPGATLGTINVTWQAVAGATSYNVYWATSSGVVLENATRVPEASNPFVHGDLSPGTTYYYVVTATGPNGESTASAEVSATALGSIGIAVLSPRPDTLVGTTFDIVVRVQSVVQLASVVAQVGSISAPLAIDLRSGLWIGSLTLTGLPSPSPQQLTVKATDVQGNSAQAVVALRYDQPPTVTLALPATDAVARPTMRVVASCQDDGPPACTELSIAVDDGSGTPVVLLTGQGNIDQTVSLAGFDGKQVQLEAVGKDATGQFTHVGHRVYVDASPHLTPVADAGTGSAIDADATRILVIDSTSSDESLRIVDRASHASTLVFTQPGPALIVQAALTPRGALFQSREPASVTPTLYEFRDGTLSTLSSGEPFGLFLVKGDYALWAILGLGTGPPDQVFRRNLVAGSTVAVGDGTSDHDVTPDGDVAFAFNEDIVFWHNGTRTFLTSDLLQTLDGGPVADGVHVVWFRRTDVWSPGSIMLFAPAGNVELAGNIMPIDFISAGRNYQVNGGWIAFTRVDPTGKLQIWVRSPAGVETQVSSLGRSSTIEALSPSGEVVFYSDATGPFRRYRGAAGSSATEIGSFLGRAIYIDGQLHVLMGATLFRVN